MAVPPRTAIIRAVPAPRVTVITATYNWSSALHYAVASALAQGFRDFEMLVVGDGCDDDSADVVAAFGDPRLQWINLPENSGHQSRPNNVGLERARGDLIAYLGHDDVWHPDHLATLVSALDDSRVDLAYAICLMSGPPGSGLLAISGLRQGRPGESNLFYPPSSICHRAALTRRIGRWRDYREIADPPDLELLTRAIASGARFAPTGELTVFKFPSAWRPGSYLRRACDEQRACLDALNDTGFRYRELLRVTDAAVNGRLLEETQRGDATTGAIVSRSRRLRGLDHRQQLVGPLRSLALDMGGILPGDQWWGPEAVAPHGFVQWTGPGCVSTLDLPLATDVDLAIRFGVIFAMAPLDSLRLSVNDREVALLSRGGDQGETAFDGVIERAMLRAADGVTRLSFTVSETRVPMQTLEGSRDPRALGLAFLYLNIESAR